MSDVNKQVEKWLDERWQQKEKQMEYFVEHQKYDNEWTANQVGWKGARVMGRECMISTLPIVLVILFPACSSFWDRFSSTFLLSNLWVRPSALSSAFFLFLVTSL